MSQLWVSVMRERFILFLEVTKSIEFTARKFLMADYFVGHLLKSLLVQRFLNDNGTEETFKIPRQEKSCPLQLLFLKHVLTSEPEAI